MITITYKICYDPPLRFRTYAQMKGGLGSDETTFKVKDLDAEGFIIKIMGLKQDGISVILDGVTNPLTQLRKEGKL